MFAIYRAKKIKTAGGIAAAAAHHDRSRTTPNATGDRDEVHQLHGPPAAAAEIMARLPQKRRSDAVLAVDLFCGASPEYFRPDNPGAAGEYDQERMEAWRDRTMQWLGDTFGKNLVSAHLHLDESTPHIQALVVPLDERGVLNAKKLFGPVALRTHQSTYAEALAPLGLQRGVEGSKAKHQDVRRFYGLVNEPTPTPATKIPKVQPPTLGEKIAEAVGMETDHTRAQRRQFAAIKKRLGEEQATRQALGAKARYADLVRGERERLATTAANLRAVADQVRDIPLVEVLERFGYERDKADPKHNWTGEKGRISTDRKGEPKFFNHDLDHGGGGAIDLAMHLGGWDFKTATAWLAGEFGAGAAVGAAMSRAAAEAKAAAAEPAPALPVPKPSQSAAKIERVRKYLTDERKLAPALVAWALEKGMIYADDHANACFHLTGGGVELRGTGEKPFHGVRGEKGVFQVMTRENPTRTVYVESAIDALSYWELHRADREPTLIVSVTGAAKAALQDHARGEIEKGRRVVAGFDNDVAGNRFAEQLREVAPDAEVDRPRYGKDWNDALKIEREPAQDRGRDFEPEM